MILITLAAFGYVYFVLLCIRYAISVYILRHPKEVVNKQIDEHGLYYFIEE